RDMGTIRGNGRAEYGRPNIEWTSALLVIPKSRSDIRNPAPLLATPQQRRWMTRFARPFGAASGAALRVFCARSACPAFAGMTSSILSPPHEQSVQFRQAQLRPRGPPVVALAG